MRDTRHGTRQATVNVRDLNDLADLRVVDALFVDVWGPGMPVLGVELLRAVSHAGGCVAGAFLGDELVGATAAFLGRHAGRLCLHSHLTGVSPHAQGAHVGRALKLHQRDWARRRGIEVVTWTFDPLVRRNAWFNIARLGALPVEYLIDFYGTMPDPMNAGAESDRLLMAWEVSAPLPESELVGTGDGFRLVPTPADIHYLRRTDPRVAREWRLVLREALRGPVAEGRVVGFTREGEYVITAPSSAP